MKIKRSHRLIDITQFLLTHPHTLISLVAFVQRYQASKSSISEDLTIIKEQFAASNLGRVETISGAAGGVIYIPQVSKEAAYAIIAELCETLASTKRILPGGYFYLTDILGDPNKLRQIGQVIAGHFADSGATAIMTIATKGVPLAQMVALYLNVPFIIVNRNSKVTEGPTVSINYASRGDNRVEKMELTRSSLAENSRVLIIDDFMNGGGTITGMLSMLEQFNSTCVGVSVLCEADEVNRDVEFEYHSLMKVKKSGSHLTIKPGTLFD